MKKETFEMKSANYGTRSFTVELPESVQESIATLGPEKTLAAIHRGLKIAARGAAWGEVAERETTKVEVGGKKVSASKTLAAEVDRLRAELAKAQSGSGQAQGHPQKR